MDGGSVDDSEAEKKSVLLYPLVAIYLHCFSRCVYIDVQ